MMMTQPPILYSLLNCPYAMRARIALFKAEQVVRIRAIKLNNKPHEMLLASPKGSVPVLVIQDGDESNSTKIIEESLEVMLWALSQNDPEDLLHIADKHALPAMMTFILEFEHDFLPAYHAYSSAKRYHEKHEAASRQACETHLTQLEKRLSQHAYLFSNRESLVDIALLPFLRKFARIDKQWFRQSPYPKLRLWLRKYLDSAMFSKVMKQHELWLVNRKDIYFGESNEY